MKKYLYHITDSVYWQEAQRSGEYRHPSLDTDGFIHCSYEEQVEKVYQSFYAKESKDDLVLLKIDDAKVQSKVKLESDSRSGTQFPHIYGAFKLSAVKDVKRITQGSALKLR